MRHEPDNGSNVQTYVCARTLSSKTHNNLFILLCLHFLNYPSTSNYSMKARTFPPFVHAHRATEVGVSSISGSQSPSSSCQSVSACCAGSSVCRSSSVSINIALVAYRLVGHHFFPHVFLSRTTNFPANCDNDLRKHVRTYTGTIYGKIVKILLSRFLRCYISRSTRFGDV